VIVGLTVGVGVGVLVRGGGSSSAASAEVFAAGGTVAAARAVSARATRRKHAGPSASLISGICLPPFREPSATPRPRQAEQADPNHRKPMPSPAPHGFP